MLGFTFELGSEKEMWGVTDFWGTWADGPTENSKWTAQDQLNSWGKSCEKVRKLLKDANVSSLSDLIETPVECTFEFGSLKSWRILMEAI